MLQHVDLFLLLFDDFDRYIIYGEENGYSLKFLWRGSNLSEKLSPTAHMPDLLRQGECHRKIDCATVLMAVPAMTNKKANIIEVVRRFGVIITTHYAYVNGDNTLKQAG